MGPRSLTAVRSSLRSAAYRYYRFQVNSTQGGNIVQLSELAFYSSGLNNINGARVLPTGYFGGGTWNGGEDPTKAYDNNTATKWCDTTATMPQYLTFDFGTAQAFTGYDWATAKDSTPARSEFTDCPRQQRQQHLDNTRHRDERWQHAHLHLYLCRRLVS